MGLEALGQPDDSGKALAEIVQPPKAVRAVPAPTTPRVTDCGRLASYAKSAWNGEVGRLLAMSEAATPDGIGYRGEPWDQTTFEVACNLLELANADWTPYDVNDALVAVTQNAPRDSGFTDDDVAKKIDSAVAKVGDKARSAPVERIDIAAEVDTWDLRSEPTTAPQEASDKPPASVRFPRIDWDELFATAVREDPDWVVEPLVERGNITSIYSPPKEGKSLVTLDGVAAAAAGRSVFGYPPREPVVVVYIDKENSRDDLRERLTALGYGAGDLGNLVYLSFSDVPHLDTPAGGIALDEIVDAYGGELVVFDTISRFIDGDEDSADTWAKVYSHSLVRLKARGVAVLRLDHAGKDVRRGQRGSSAKAADVDAVWRLQANGTGSRTLIREATRNGHGPDRVTLLVQTEPVLRHLSPTTSVDPEVAALVTALDDLGLPGEVGRVKAREALDGTDIKTSNKVLEDAIRVRKARKTCPQIGGQVDLDAATAPAREAAPGGTDSTPTTPPLTCENTSEQEVTGRSAGRSGRSSSGSKATCPSAPVPKGRAGSPSPARSKECGGCGSPFITRADGELCVWCQQVAS